MGTTMSSEAGYQQPAGGQQATPVNTRPLVVVGSMAADLVLSVDRLPRPGETIAATNCERFPGGKVVGADPAIPPLLGCVSCTHHMGAGLHLYACINARLDGQSRTAGGVIIWR